MNYNAILERILNTVDHEAYVFSESHLSPKDAAAQRAIHELLADANVPVEQIKRRVDELHTKGDIDAIKRLSLLHVVAAHPRVKDYLEAARLVAEQEMNAWELTGSEREVQLAAVDRHRGVLAFLKGHYDHALDHFARALERERTATNLQNVLAALIRLGEEDDARSLLVQIRTSYPSSVVTELSSLIQKDPDLALLR